jgi:protein-S-isoprenylcysteine O-methyltransferase Ste14
MFGPFLLCQGSEVLFMGLQLGILMVGTVVILWVSRHNILQIRQHGFYRMLAWEAILIAFVMNMNYWFVDPFSLSQLIAWTLLILSLVLILIGVRAFRQEGAIDPQRPDQGLVGIEKTTQLVTTGIYGHIRHPFYSSLLFLNWGIFFKDLSAPSLILALFATVFLFITAKIEEQENVNFFGESYLEYMTNTKMFIPFVI